ncbi:MAG: lipocalin family protein [Conchiformibius sp.]|nr:lipocalin family protein [Conchiformibius sp.]
MKHQWKLLSALLFSAAVHAAPLAELLTVDKVDVARYAGTWYEIAHLPMPFQKQCAAHVTARYTVNDNNTITVTNRCQKANGSWSEAEGLARPQNEGNSKLSVTFLPKWLRWLPFGRAPYWVMALDDNYETVMVGQPDRKYLWLLSRQPQMDEKVYQAYLQQAKAQGYDLSALIRTRQH